MRIVQLVSPTATTFEHMCQRLDFHLLQGEHDVTCVTSSAIRRPRVAGADVLHFYGERPRIARPKSGWFTRERSIPVSPLDNLPEAVEDEYWDYPLTGDRRIANVGSLGRRGLRSLTEQTIARLHRTREDVEWLSFDAPPTPEELATIGVWVDPATDPRDFDGMIPHAIVSGTPVVASRTPINVQRLENGRTGFLVPANDPNELAHAILSALFKPEVAQQKIDAARQTKAKFRARQRLRALSKLYDALLA